MWHVDLGALRRPFSFIVINRCSGGPLVGPYASFQLATRFLHAQVTPSDKWGTSRASTDRIQRAGKTLRIIAIFKNMKRSLSTVTAPSGLYFPARVLATALILSSLLWLVISCAVVAVTTAPDTSVTSGSIGVEQKSKRGKGHGS